MAIKKMNIYVKKYMKECYDSANGARWEGNGKVPSYINEYDKKIYYFYLELFENKKQKQKIVESENYPLQLPVDSHFLCKDKKNLNEYLKIRDNIDSKKQRGLNTYMFLYNNNIYVAEGPYGEEEASLLVMDAYEAERRKVERLKSKFSGQKESKNKRVRIPESVRIEVWRRDQGICAQCGSREKLEYDHIVPVSKGGSNTSRNLELLCEQCNREKSNNIQ